MAAYPHATVGQVKTALDARARLIDFAVRAQDMAPGDLQRAFAEEF